MKKMVQSVKEAFRPYVPDEKELDEFGIWAFGEDFLELETAIKYLECWNWHHGKELHLSPTGQVAEDAPKMVAMWRASKK